MKTRNGVCRFLSVLLMTALITGFSGAGFAEEDAAPCGGVLQAWQAAADEVGRAVSEFNRIEDMSLTDFVQRPLVDVNVGKTIARQVGEAIDAKEKKLNEIRTRCRELLKREAAAHEALDSCMDNEKGRDVRRTIRTVERERKRLIRKALAAVADVKSVEGKEQHYPQYVDSWRGGSGYPQGGYYENYRRMYNSYWGYR